MISDFYCRISMNIDKPMIKEPTIPPSCHLVYLLVRHGSRRAIYLEDEPRWNLEATEDFFYVRCIIH